MTSPISDGKRTISLPLDRVFSVGGGVEWQWHGMTLHANLNYADLGDGEVDQQGGQFTGRVSGEFDQHYAVVLDLQLRKRF